MEDTLCPWPDRRLECACVTAWGVRGSASGLRCG